MLVTPMGFASGSYSALRGNASAERKPRVAVQPRRRRSVRAKK